MNPHNSLLEILKPAYSPCPNFGVCKQAKWAPEAGQIPRGFVGATGNPDDVEVIMVFSEPGHPHANERHNAFSTPIELMSSAVAHARICFETQTD